MRLPVFTPNSRAASAPAPLAAALAALLVFSPIQQTFSPLRVPAAHAKELASGSGSKVNKDPRSLLRLGLPGQPKEVRELQANMEEAQDQISRLLFGKSGDALDKARGVIKGKSDKMLAAVPAADKETGKALLESMDANLLKFRVQLGAGSGSGATEAGVAALDDLSKFEGLIATTAKPLPVPSEFNNIPQLNKRATVEFVIKKEGSAQFDIDGNLFKEARLSMIIDGYTAPVTAGNFVDLVQRGYYNGMHIQRSDGFVVQMGDPSKESGGQEKINGFVPAGADKVRTIPLEVLVKGDKAPIYGSTFDDDGRGGFAAELPFNAYGALGMAREEYSADSASSQFFWLLFDSDLTPAGKNLLDGRYSCFGYTIDGARFLSDIKEGDIIVSAKVVEGGENLMPPKA